MSSYTTMDRSASSSAPAHSSKTRKHRFRLRTFRTTLWRVRFFSLFYVFTHTQTRLRSVNRCGECVVLVVACENSKNEATVTVHGKKRYFSLFEAAYRHGRIAMRTRVAHDFERITMLIKVVDAQRLQQIAGRERWIHIVFTAQTIHYFFTHGDCSSLL